ncbi:DUF6432 family protein [Natronolimnohabitans sp. A-GB9]|uniref:DUF6432 family protein n=1 Tax=Natronolimnohabitans sp. A-GB9 TaxID=3069757 RepID=UPI0027B3277E|nr:DUF6432 family protein [Natronolimnohabitans sp. A-GB9]MDQ2051084.1 DUF6432 family protein [Natronolimnohabitans sp. A-GB9]
MRAKREYRDRESTQVAVLDALVNRAEEGMNVFELRAAVEVDIDDLEDALATLKEDDLIVVESESNETVIKPDERVVPEVPTDETDDQSIGEWLRERLPF